jgi:hypothetical protein
MRLQPAERGEIAVPVRAAVIDVAGAGTSTPALLAAIMVPGAAGVPPLGVGVTPLPETSLAVAWSGASGGAVGQVGGAGCGRVTDMDADAATTADRLGCADPGTMRPSACSSE